MKPINEMNLSECIDEMRLCQSEPDTIIELADRISELTRWIPVSERMPTGEDAYKGQVFVFVDGQAESWPFNDLGNATHWCRITPPEDK